MSLLDCLKKDNKNKDFWETDDHFMWSPGYIHQLSPNFKTTEFECPAKKETQKISKILIKRLQALREELGMPLTVTSGYRTEAYQDELAAILDKDGNPVYKIAKKSQHLEGNAVDVTCRDMSKLLKLCREYFDAVGKARSFIHVDTRSDKKRSWGY